MFSHYVRSLKYALIEAEWSIYNKVTLVFRKDQQKPRYFEVTQINGLDWIIAFCSLL